MMGREELPRLLEVFPHLFNGRTIEPRLVVLLSEEFQNAEQGGAGTGAEIEDPEPVFREKLPRMEREFPERKGDF